MTSDRDWDPETVFDVLGSELARRILALAEAKPRSAEELTAHCDASKPTVYRRLSALREYDLIVERTAVDDEGTHYKTYDTALDSIRFSVEPGQFEVDIQLARTLVDEESDRRSVTHEVVADEQ